MSVIFVMSCASVAAVLLTLSRVVGWHWIMRNATIVDVVFTVGVGLLMMGTLTGMLVAILGGLIMACTLTAFKLIAKAANSVKPVKAKSIDDEHDAHGVWIYNTTQYL